MKIAKLKVPTPPKFTGSTEAKNKKFVSIGYVKKQIVSEDDPRVKGSIEVFDTLLQLEQKMKKRKNIWAHYEFNYEINDDTKLQYESFFSGFLHYYDTELRNGMSDHTLWCNWNKKGKKDTVTVYLYPAPLRHPMKRSAANPTLKTAGDFIDLMNTKNKELVDTIYNNGWNPPGVQGLQSDPPTPTGPPPPSA